MADELIAMARFFTRGIPVDKETLALEALERVKGAGDRAIFLTDDHTFDNFEQALFLPRLLDRARYDGWAEAGSLDLYQRCNAEAKRILAEHQMAPKADDKVGKEIDALIAKL